MMSLEKQIADIQAMGYTPQAAMILLSEYYKQRAAGTPVEEAQSLFMYDFIESNSSPSETIFREIRTFHKRLCEKGFKPEQVADIVEAFYKKEE